MIFCLDESCEGKEEVEGALYIEEGSSRRRKNKIEQIR
jgi:hypothetical protein